MVGAFRQQLTDVKSVLPDNSNVQIVIAPVTAQGAPGDWTDEQLQITDYYVSP